MPPKTFLGGSLRVFLKEIKVWFSRLSKDSLPPQCGCGPSSPLTALIEQKGKGRKNALSSWAGISIFSCPQTWDLLFSDLWVLGLMPVALQFSGLWPQTRSYTSGSLDSQAFRFRMNYTTSVSDSPVWRWQTVGLLDLHNLMSQFL